MSNICTPYYDNQYEAWVRSKGAVATSVAIMHPNIYYFVLDASWSSNNSLEFWNKGNTNRTINNNTVHKTIYSPSPTGYAEPKSAAFTGFTTTGNNSSNASEYNVSGGFNNGWNFYCQPKYMGTTVFFQDLGMRHIGSWAYNYSTGGSVALGDGDYWTAGPASDDNCGCVFDISSGSIYVQGSNNRAFGFSVRPVFE